MTISTAFALQVVDFSPKFLGLVEAAFAGKVRFEPTMAILYETADFDGAKTLGPIFWFRLLFIFLSGRRAQQLLLSRFYFFIGDSLLRRLG